MATLTRKDEDWRTLLKDARDLIKDARVAADDAEKRCVRTEAMVDGLKVEISQLRVAHEIAKQDVVTARQSALKEIEGLRFEAEELRERIVIVEASERRCREEMAAVKEDAKVKEEKLSVLAAELETLKKAA